MIRLGPLAVAACVPLASLRAQGGLMARAAGQGILVYASVDPIPGGGRLGEARLVQPMLMLDVRAPRAGVQLHVSLDFEGLTMSNGELAPGVWGEGYVDRRHPHTYLHELMLTAADILRPLAAPVRATLSVGKGFVPFGTDDPMSRPAERFPVNHHLSQILERAVARAAVERGDLSLEGAIFNGDEPENPGQGPNLGRFADSWSLRLTLRPLAGVEWQASTALVHSPENRLGAGTDARKWSTSLRGDQPLGRTRAYGLVEWARTSEANGFVVFSTVLAEGGLTAGRHRPYYRFERTERPEDARSLDLFRTVRPHLDNSIIGVTRWTIHTAGYCARLTAETERLEVAPFVEASYGRIAAVDGGLFDPVGFYGRESFWGASIGVHLAWGMAGHRMGQYGVPMTTGEMSHMRTSGSHGH